MQLKDAMLDQLAIARRIVTDGHEVVPAWRIRCADGDWLVLTRFDHDKPGQRDRAVTLMKRFMAWKLAQSFILTTETWLGSVETRAGEEAIATVGMSRAERFGILQIIRRNGAVRFEPPLWLSIEQMDSLYWSMLRQREESITAEEARALELIFGENGEFPAHKVSEAPWRGFGSAAYCAAPASNTPRPAARASHRLRDCQQWSLHVEPMPLGEFVRAKARPITTSVFS